MKKIFTVLFLLVLVCVPVVASAQNNNIIAPLNTGDTKSPIYNAGQVYNLVISVIRWMYTIFFVLTVMFILLAAYNFIIGGSGGTNEAKIKIAKNQLKYAVIAIVIALISAGVAEMVKNFIENPSAGSEPVPTVQSGN